MTTPHRQHTLDTTPAAVPCHYATDPTRRPPCTLTAHARYATIPLCPTCAQQRSTLGKGHTPIPLHTTPPLDVLTWITHAQAAARDAHNTLTAAITRARSQGHTWTQIGNQLGTTRQTPQQRLKSRRG